MALPSSQTEDNLLTRVVNLRRDPYDVYIGRAGKGHDGYFGNPHAVGQACTRCRTTHGTGASTLPCFTLYFQHRLGTDAEFRARVLALRGKVLGCFCHPNPCHGNVIAAFLNRSREKIEVDIEWLTQCWSPRP
jgi:hypothetical protein